MRRYRERAKSGGVFIRFEMTPAAVDRLIALGWLKPEDRRNSHEVANALIRFVTAALWPQGSTDARSVYDRSPVQNGVGSSGFESYDLPRCDPMLAVMSAFRAKDPPLKSDLGRSCKSV
jgi:hypothetical protein